LHSILKALSKHPFAVIGHRGAAGLALENTLTAFKKALEVGVDIAEFDVQVTADGIPVLLHDETLERIAGVHINVRNTSFSKLKNITLPNGEKLATLEELLALDSGKLPLFIEVKHAKDTNKVLEVIAREKATDYVAVISFHEEALRIAKKKLPTIPRGLIYATPPGKIIEARRLGCQIVLPRYTLATEKAVAFAHRLGLKVVAWTVNDTLTATRLVKRGVDAIASDYPDRMIELRKRLTTTAKRQSL